MKPLRVAFFSFVNRFSNLIFLSVYLQNLPRMQGAFIDALVIPVFKLLAELLPMVDTHCIKQLHINRSFWNSMQNQSIITTENIVSYLKGVRQETSSTEEDAESLTGSDPNGPIPGIPANARQGSEHETVRKLSLVPIQGQNINLEDLESGNLPARVEASKLKIADRKYLKWIKQKLSETLDSGFTQMILMIATIVALFANDMNLVVGNKGTDFGVEIVIFVVFVIFAIEFMTSILCVPKYTHFFLWLDLAAGVSLLLEIDFLLEMGSSSTGDLSLAKASRAAKIGARAGR